MITYRHATAGALLAASTVIVVLGGLGVVHMPGVVVSMMAAFNTVAGLRLMAAVQTSSRRARRARRNGGV